MATPTFKSFLRWKRASADAIGKDPEIIQEIVNNNTFVTEVTQNVEFITNLVENNEFITQLVENNTFVTELTENNDFITQVTENNTFVTNITQQINANLNGKKGIANELATLDASGKITASQLPPAMINFAIDGGGAAIPAGLKGFAVVPFDCTITRVDVLSDVSGSIVVDIWRDTYANHPPADADSITSATPPTLSSAIKSSNTSLTGWTTQLNEGDILAFNVDSATTVTSVTIAIKVTKR